MPHSELNKFDFILSMAKKRGLSADEKKQKMLQSMLAGVMEWKACNVVAIGIQHEGAGKDGKR